MKKIFLLLVISVCMGVKSWGQTTGTWSGASSGAWLTAGNWNTVPGSSSTTSNTDIAYFNNNNQTTVGMNMNTAGQHYYLGALNFGTSATTARTINNSSSTYWGTYYLNGATLNSVANTVLWNQSSATHIITQGSVKGCALAFPNSPGSVIQVTGAGGLTIADTISSSAGVITITGSGGGTVSFTSPSNTFYTSGNIFNITGSEVSFSADLSAGQTPGSTVSNYFIVDGGRLTLGASFTLSSSRGIQVGSTTGTSLSVTSSLTGTYNGIIADKTSSTGILVKQGAGTLVLGGASTYSGATTINNGTIQLGANSGSNRLPTGTLLTLGSSSKTCVFDLNGNNQQVAGLVSAASTSNSVTSSFSAILTIGGSGTNTYGGSNAGTIGGSISLIMNGSGTQILGSANTYTGNTTISAGTLALSGSGSIANSPNIIIGSGGTFDVSGLTTALALGLGQTLQVSATGSNATGTLTVASSDGLTLSSGGLAFTAYGGGVTVPLTVTGATAGALALNNAPITITTTTALTAGTYVLIDKSNSATGVTGTPGTLTVNGSGLAGAGSLSVSNGKLILTVTTPSIALSSPSIPISNLSVNTTNNIIGAVQLAVTVANATLNSVTFTTAGSYATIDIATNGFKFWLSSSATDISSATQLGAAQAAAGNGSTISVSGLSNTISSGTTRYIVLSADIAASPTNGATIGIGSTAFSNINFAAGTKTGSDPVAAGSTRTITLSVPSIAISSNHPSSASLNQNATNQNIASIALSVTTANATLNSVTFTTAGTYQTGDLMASSFKLYYTTSNSFSTATQLGSAQAIVASGNTVTFSSLAQTINSGTTGYLWLTVDVAYNAGTSRNISIASTAFSNIVFGSGNKTGTDPVAAGNTMSFAAVTPNVAIAPVTVSAGSIQNGSTNNILANLSLAVTSNATNLTGITFNTDASNSYSATDITNFKLWYGTSNSFGSAVQIGSTVTSINSPGGTIVFSSLSQNIAASATGYIWLTTDIAAGASAGKTINIATMAFSNITFDNSAVKTGTDPVTAFGLQTIAISNRYLTGSQTWNSSNTNWSTTSGGTYNTAWLSNSIANFEGSSATVTVSGTQTANGLNFNQTTSSTTTVSGSGITLSGTASILVGNGSTNQSIYINSNLSAANLLTIGLNSGASGNSTLNLGGSNTFSGGLQINSGFLNRINFNAASAAGSGGITLNANNIRFTNSGTPGDISASTVVSIPALTLNISSGSPKTVALGATNNSNLTSLNYNGVISGTLDIVYIGNATGDAGGGAGQTFFNNNNTYNASTVFNASSSVNLKLGVDNALPTNTALVFNKGNGGLNTNGYNQKVASIADGVSGATPANPPGGIILSSGKVFSIEGSASTSYSGVISGGGSLTLTSSNSGTQTLAGANTYTGSTTVNGGILQLNYSSGNTIPATNSITVSGGTLQISSNQTLNNLDLSGGGNLTVDNGVTLTITGTFTGGSGTITNNGTIKTAVTTATPIPSGKTWGGTIEYSATNGTQTIVAGTYNNLTVDNSTGTNTAGGDVTVSGTLTTTSGGTFAVGSNTLTLNGPAITGSGILSTTASSNLSFGGTNAGPLNIPSSVTALNNLTLNNTNATAAVLNCNSGITINGTLTVTSGKLITGVNNLILNASTGSAIIAPNAALNVTGSSSNFNGRPVTVQSTTAGDGMILHGASSISGASAVTLQRYLGSNQRAWRLLGNPTNSSISWSQLATNSNIDLTGTGSNASGETFSTSNNYFSGYGATSENIPTAQSGSGYSLFVRGTSGQGINGDRLYNTAASPGGVPGHVTIAVTGTLNTATVSISTTYTGTNGNNYYLIANPFAAPVSAAAIINASTGLKSGIYYWDASLGGGGVATVFAGGYQTTQISGSSGGSGDYIIPIMGSIFVEALSSGSINIPASAVYTGSYSHITPYGTGTETNHIGLTILKDTIPFDYLNIYLHEKASAASTDGLDFKKMNNTNLSFYSISSDSKNLSIDERPIATQTIPLGLQTNLQTAFTIKADALNTPAGTEVYLTDNLLGTCTLLTEGTSYSFNVSADSLTKGNNRFELSYKAKSAVAAPVDNTNSTQITVYPNPAHDYVMINTGGSTASDITIYDSKGVLIRTEKSAAGGTVKIATGNWGGGVYLIKINDGQKTTVKKMVIR